MLGMAQKHKQNNKKNPQDFYFNFSLLIYNIPQSSIQIGTILLSYY